MRVGSLRNLVIIEEYVETVSSYGGTVKTWSEYGRAWAAINALRGDEKYISAEKQATSTHQMTIRFLDGVNPKMRVVFGTRIFEIVSVINPGEWDKRMNLIVTEESDK